MLRRTSHVLLEVLAAIAVGLVLVVIGGAWRLSQGPVSLEFLKPYVDTELAALEGPFGVEIEDVILKWAGWERALDIVVVNVRVTAADGGVVALAPELSVSVSAIKALRGVISPTTLELIRPQINMVRNRARGFAFGPGKEARESDVLLNFVADALAAMRRPDSLLGQLKRISIIGGTLRVDDRLVGDTWGASHADIVMSRSRKQGIRVEFDFDTEFKGQTPTLRGTAELDPDENAISVTAKFDKLRPDLLSEDIKALEPLRRLRFAMGGTAELRLGMDGTLQYVIYDLLGGEGVIDLPHPHLRALKVRSITLRGRADSGPERLAIESLKVDLGGPKLEIAANITRSGGVTGFKAEALVRGLPIDDLGRYWPPDVVKGARKWITTNMHDGRISEARFSMSGRVDEANGNGGGETVSVDKIGATIDFEDATVRFIKAMAPVRKVRTTAIIDADRIRLMVHGGTLGKLAASEGVIEMTDLDADRPLMSAEIVINGSLDAVLAMLDQPALRYASKFGLDPASVRGTTAIRLTARLPMIDALTLAEVDIRAAANLKDVTIPKAVFGKSLTQGQLSLRLDSKAMSIIGLASIDGIPGDIAWYENFTDDAPFVRRYDFKTVLDDAARERFGIDPGHLVDGPVGTALSYVERAIGPNILVARLGLDQATLTLPGFGWSKPGGRPATAALEVAIAGDKITRISGFEIAAEGLTSSGNVEFAEGGKSISTVTLNRFALGARTDVSGSARRIADGSYMVALSGPAFDIQPFTRDSDTDTALPPFQLHAKFDTLWLSKNSAVSKSEAVIRHDGTTLRRVSLDANTGDGKGRNLSVKFTNNGGKRKILADSSDAGSLLKSFKLFESLRGGRLQVNATRDGAKSDTPWRGKLTVTDFTMTRAPAMAKLLTLASLTGIANLMSGKGVQFHLLDMPFTYASDKLKITEARAVGSELGITGKGTIDLGTELIDLDGTVVPAYTINSLLGNIPVLGALFTGGAKGGGMFAATYTMKGSFKKTVVDVNPLAALAPGFLRDLIGGMGKAGEPAGPPEPTPRE